MGDITGAMQVPCCADPTREILWVIPANPRRPQEFVKCLPLEAQRAQTKAGDSVPGDVLGRTPPGEGRGADPEVAGLPEPAPPLRAVSQKLRFSPLSEASHTEGSAFAKRLLPSAGGLAGGSPWASHAGAGLQGRARAHRRVYF